MDLKSRSDFTYPLVLNLKGIQSINSIGIRSFRDFAASWGNKPVELRECSLAMVDAINTFPGLLGDPANLERVKSILLPFSCLECCSDMTETFSVNTSAGWTPALIKAPKCGKCGEQTNLDGEFEDYFAFLDCDV